MSETLTQMISTQKELIEALKEQRQRDKNIIKLYEELNETRETLQKNSDKQIENYKSLLRIKSSQLEFVYVLTDDFGYEGEELTHIFLSFDECIKFIENSNLSFIWKPNYNGRVFLKEWDIKKQEVIVKFNLYRKYAL